MYSVKNSNKFHFISILALIFGSLFIGISLSIFTIFSQNNDISNSNNLQSILISFVQVFLVFGPVLIYFMVYKGFLKNSLYWKNPGIFNVLLAILLTWVLMPTVSLLNLFSMFFVENKIAHALKDLNQSPYLLSILIISVFPGIFEELSTRFILLNNYRYKPYYLACIMSGLFFGLIHLNVNQFIYAFVLGSIFAFMVQITESIFTSILMHITLNATSFSLGYLIEKLGSGDLLPSEPVSPGWLDVIQLLGVNVITIPLAIFIAYHLIRYNGKLGILRQKPTVLELSLGQKIPEFNPNQGLNPLPPLKPENPMGYFYGEPAPRPKTSMPAQPYMEGNPNQPGAWPNGQAGPGFENIDPYPNGQNRPSYPGPQFANWPAPANRQADPMEEAFNIYSAKFHSPWNWAFWASLIVFAGMVLLNEVLPLLME